MSVPGCEHHHDRRHARQRLGANHVDTLDAVEQVGLERDRDQLLDLVGREPECLSLHLSVWGCELREDVDRCVAQRHDAESQQSDGDAEHQKTEVQHSAEKRTHKVHLPYLPQIRIARRKSRLSAIAEREL